MPEREKERYAANRERILARAKAWRERVGRQAVVRVCRDCGAPASSQRHFLCDLCRAMKRRESGVARRRRDERERPSTTERGYGGEHKKLRAKLAKVVEAGDGFCVRCGRWVAPGELWHLGHDDFDRSRYRGIECTKCNVGAANKLRAKKSPRRDLPRRTSREW